MPEAIYISKCSAFQIQMVVQHITGFQSLSFETLSFLLTLLAATVTPVFVLSEHWIHLPCGCIINCRRNSYALSSEEFKSKDGRMTRGCDVSRSKQGRKLVSVPGVGTPWNHLPELHTHFFRTIYEPHTILARQLEKTKLIGTNGYWGTESWWFSQATGRYVSRTKGLRILVSAFSLTWERFICHNLAFTNEIQGPC